MPTEEIDRETAVADLETSRKSKKKVAIATVAAVLATAALLVIVYKLSAEDSDDATVIIEGETVAA